MKLLRQSVSALDKFRRSHFGPWIKPCLSQGRERASEDLAITSTTFSLVLLKSPAYYVRFPSGGRTYEAFFRAFMRKMHRENSWCRRVRSTSCGPCEFGET